MVDGRPLAYPESSVHAGYYTLTLALSVRHYHSNYMMLTPICYIYAIYVRSEIFTINLSWKVIANLFGI